MMMRTNLLQVVFVLWWFWNKFHTMLHALDIPKMNACQYSVYTQTIKVYRKKDHVNGLVFLLMNSIIIFGFMQLCSES